jgi:tricorn protease
MRKTLCIIFLIHFLFQYNIFSQISSFAEPGISPNGQDIAFVSGGDIWTVSSKGGDARLLVSNPAAESRPLYSPDGKRLAFTSSRTGNGDVYILNLETGDVKRLTFDDGNEQISAWSRDGSKVYFQGTMQDIAGMNDIYTVSIEGGTPMPISADRYANEYFASPSPDGSTVAFSARGIASAQWWRNGRSHIDEAEIWLKKTTNGVKYEQLTESGSKDLWPLWSADGKTIFYVSDKNSAQNIWMKPLTGKATQLSQFNKGRVLWASISNDGKTIAFERDFQIWKFDISSKKASPIPIKLVGTSSNSAVEHLRLTSQFSELALAPDGKKLAFVAHGDVFAASSKDGGDAERVTKTAAVEGSPAWSPNSRSLVYTSDRNGVKQLFQYDFMTRTETQLTNDSQNDGQVAFAPDGKTLAFIRNGTEIRLLDLQAKKESLLTKGYFGTLVFGGNDKLMWSPDGKWLAFEAYGVKSFLNIYVAPISPNYVEPKQVSFLANSFGGSPIWSPDSTYILFTSTQRTEDASVARIDLVTKTPKFREDQFRELFQEETAKNAKLNDTSVKNKDKTSPTDTIIPPLSKTPEKTVKINFEGINQRLSLLPVGVNVGEVALTKDGKTLVMTASVGGQVNIYTYSLDELSREPAVAKQITTTLGNKSNLQLSPDGKESFYLEQGRIQSVGLESRQVKPLSVTAELDVDFATEKIQVFRQAWSVQNEAFYDPNFHGVDWKAIRQQYEPLAAGAQTPDELRRLLNLLVGELNASHSGASAPFLATAPQASVGRLGLRFDPLEYELTKRLKISEIIALGPADISGKIKVGDYIVAVDDSLINARSNFYQLLENKVNKRVVLKISSSANGSSPQEIVIRPISLGAEKGLLYRQWVQQQRDFVFKASNGRLGYAHIIDMSSASLAQFYLDLDSENHAREGVVIDVRNNNGGFVNAYALDVLTRKAYMTMQPRGLQAASARSQLGQRALESPTILVTNQHSLSDAEDFSEGYHTLKLGKIVGEPTASWIIYTSSVTLIDGTNLRLPFIKITDNSGKNMELTPRPVDIPVVRPIGESYTDKNIQLETAVKELLMQLDKGKK